MHAHGSAPLEGVCLGRNLLSNELVCCNQISWFQNVRLISNPSAFVMANPGLGKSSLLRRMAIGLCAFGVNPMILGDIKGEHIDMIEELGGKGLPLGRGIGHINPLGDAAALEAATRLSPVKREELLTELPRTTSWTRRSSHRDPGAKYRSVSMRSRSSTGA